MELGGWHQVTAALLKTKQSWVHIGQTAGWVSYCLGPVVNGHIFAPLGNEPRFFWRPTCSVITMLTELPGLLTPFVATQNKHLFESTCGDKQVG